MQENLNIKDYKNVGNTEKLRTISFCAGYGGIERGLEITGLSLRVIAYVEIEAFVIQNLVEKMESGQLDCAPVWTNLKAFPVGKFFGSVDCITAGFPCQPFSAAGKREADTDPRHLFPYIKEYIRLLRPRKVILENVAGIANAKLAGNGWEDQSGTPILLYVCRELERIGYRVTPVLQSAAGVGAPHLRERWFIFGELADTIDTGLQGHSRDEYEKRRKRERQARSIAKKGLLHRTSWPTGPGEPQYEWEEPRVV